MAGSYSDEDINSQVALRQQMDALYNAYKAQFAQQGGQTLPDEPVRGATVRPSGANYYDFLTTPGGQQYLALKNQMGAKQNQMEETANSMGVGGVLGLGESVANATALPMVNWAAEHPLEAALLWTGASLAAPSFGVAEGASASGLGSAGAAEAFTASPLTGLGASGGLTTGAASIPTLAELGYGAGSLGAVGSGVGALSAGGTTVAPFSASPLEALGASGGLTSGTASLPTLAELGYGADALGGLGSGVKTLGAGDTPVTAFKAQPMTGLGANGGLSDTALSLTKAGGSSVMDTIKSAVSNPLVKNGLTAVGAIAGAADAGKGSDASMSSQIDPRMAQYLYGTGYGDPNSLLGAAQALWKQNPSGINPLMQQGLDMARAALTAPAYGQSYTNMRDIGNSLMSGGIAGNPFTSGGRQLGAMPQMGQMPGMVQEPRAFAGGTMGFDERTGRMSGGLGGAPQGMNQAQESAQLGGSGAQMTDVMRRIIGGARNQAGADVAAPPAAMAAGDFDPQFGQGLLRQAAPSGSPGLLSAGIQQMRALPYMGRGLL